MNPSPSSLFLCTAVGGLLTENPDNRPTVLTPWLRERRYVAVSATGCRKLREDFELGLAIASGASHEVRSKVLYCHCGEGQPCHGDVILLEGLCLCEVEWALKNHLRLSPRSRGSAMQVQHLLAGEKEYASSLSAVVKTTKAEMELSMTSARGDPVYEAAVDVRMLAGKPVTVERGARPAILPAANSCAPGSPSTVAALCQRFLSASPSYLVRIGPPLSRPPGWTTLERSSCLDNLGTDCCSLACRAHGSSASH